MSQEEQIGYIKGKVENLENDLAEIKEAVKDNRENSLEKRDELLEEIRAVRNELNIYKHVWWTLKAVVLALISMGLFKIDYIIEVIKHWGKP